MLFDSSCLLCRSSTGPICAGCAARLHRPDDTGIVDLGAPSIPSRSLMRYERVGRDLVTTLKYRNGRRLIPSLAPLLAELIVDLDADLLTWVPASSAGRRQRGFDQGRLLARAVAGQARLPALGLLGRRSGPAQTGRSADGRAEGPQLFGRRRGAGRVVVVDDVITTGASLAKACGVLRGEGWDPVGALTVAATPRHITGSTGPHHGSPTAHA